MWRLSREAVDQRDEKEVEIRPSVHLAIGSAEPSCEIPEPSDDAQLGTRSGSQETKVGQAMGREPVHLTMRSSDD